MTDKQFTIEVSKAISDVEQAVQAVTESPKNKERIELARLQILRAKVVLQREALRILTGR